MKKSDLNWPDNTSSITKYQTTHKSSATLECMAKNVTRLFTAFQPESYQVFTSISENKQSFTGKTYIKGVKTGRPSNRITLHQKNLKIRAITLTGIDKKGQRQELTVHRFVCHNTFNELRIHTEHPLYAGSYEITIEYSGKITKNMDGIYPCFFVQDGEDKQLIATQFESHHAREVFPCIDEPEAKATFQLSLEHDCKEVALSNTPILEQSTAGNRTHTLFEPTPIMSTYLVAFVVGELEYREKRNKRGVLFRTYALRDQIENSHFALDVAVKALDFYEAYYDIPFPLPKCDFVALPDFASGAMENWGLITFREQTLLVDEHTSVSTKQYVAIVVAHELTHQWFGNLVTMRWWTDLWLNEGFASWMEYLAIDNLFPEWHMWTQFAVDEQQSALRADSLEHTHPIEVPVHHPDEIRTIFDIISYQKGASVIHMLFGFLGEEAFRDGLRHYLKKFSYKNADTRDLWQSLEESSGKPVMDFMHSWTSQDGFPLVRVYKENAVCKLTQQRFVTNPLSESRNSTMLWQIPLLTKQLPITTIGKREIKVKTPNNVVLINTNQAGFYRVDYSHEMQIEIVKMIDTGEVSEIDKMGLLADGFEITRAGYQSVSEYLDLLSHYKKESSLPVWDLIAQTLAAIRQTLSSDDTDNQLRDAMKPFIDDLTGLQLSRLGWDKVDGESYLDILLRPLIIALSASSDNPKTIEKLLTLYSMRLGGNGIVDPDIRATVYSTAVRHNGNEVFDQLLTLYKQTTSSDEKLSITMAMTSFEKTSMHEKVLSLITSDVVRLQDVGYWIAYSFMNRHTRKLTWEWLTQNWHWLKDNIGTDLAFYRMPVYAARGFADETAKQSYIDFFTAHMEPVLRRSYDQGLEMIETNTAWRQRDAKAALQWFKDQQM
jgi:puromycin-sensitive aminopeptidase